MDIDEYDYQDGDHCLLIGDGKVKHYCLQYADGTVTLASTGEILSA